MTGTIKGSYLNAAVIGSADLEASLAFYRDHAGLEVVARHDGVHDVFNAHWRLPAGTATKTAVVADRGERVGRILLVDVPGAERTPIRPFDHQRAWGLLNINFYTADIHAHWRELTAAGIRAWTEPVRHQMAPNVGSPTEVMLDGPDGVIVNLVELTTTDPATEIGRMRAYVANEYGYNDKGFTAVVTTLHSVRDTDAQVRFLEQVLGMRKFIDETMASAEQNVFLGFDPGSRMRCTFCRSAHPFGKIAMMEPLNIDFLDVVPAAVLPNIGYVAQSFVVDDLAAALDACGPAGAALHSPPIEMDSLGLGRARAAIVRAPGSGALQELVEILPG